MPTIVNKAPLNNTGSRPITAHSTFPLNQRIAGGYTFGLYQPCYAEDVVPDDTIPVRSAHDVRSMNLKAPLMADVQLHKEFFDVPLSAILPRNYEKLIVQPNIGEDIDASEIGCNIAGLPSLFQGQLLVLAEQIDMGFQAGNNFNATAHDIFDLANYLKMTFSAGSLFSSLGLDLSGLWNFDVNQDLIVRSCDTFIDDILKFPLLIATEYSSTFNAVIGGKSFVVRVDSEIDSTDAFYLSYRQFLERIYDESDFSVDFGGDDASYYQILSDNWDRYLIDGFEAFISNHLSGSALSKPLNISKIIAYQLCCAEFFTNSHVDYIYSAELYRQNFNSLLFDSGAFSLSRDTFSWNGVDYEYDTFSAHNLKRMLHNQFAYTNQSLVMSGIRLLFGYNRSLRYVDYFTGSRTRPLAVGDVNVQVNSGYVNIVDTIQKRWYAKFLNQVNRAGRKLSEYSRAMFPNLTSHRDLHEPMWLAHISDSVNPQESDSTTQDRLDVANTTSARFFSNGERFAFEYTPERYGVCIGILYFDIQRYYPHIIERTNFNVDRNDYFNPYLQFVGDQPVYKDELHSGLVHNEIDNFGYQGRDMQYKQKVDRCFGPFSVSGILPGWLYTAPDYINKRYKMEIGPDFIRAYPSELDSFYSQLTGYSPATYFHFLIINTNNCNAKRPMVANPQLD